MIKDLTKEDLINLVNRVSPSYDLFENKTVKECGDYNGSYGTWYWMNHKLGELSDSELWDLYQLCLHAYD